MLSSHISFSCFFHGRRFHYPSSVHVRNAFWDSNELLFSFVVLSGVLLFLLPDVFRGTAIQCRITKTGRRDVIIRSFVFPLSFHS